MPLGHYRSPDRSSVPTRAVVVGEALVDQVISPGGVTCQPGGSPAHVASLLSSWDRLVSLTTRIGCDDAGRMVEQWLRDSGLALSAEMYSQEPTNVASVSPTGGYTFAVHSLLPARLAPPPADTVVLHTGSLVTIDPLTQPMVLKTMRQARPRATICFDPNIRPHLITDADMVRRRIRECVATSDVVKLSEEDARWIDPTKDPLELCEAWLAMDDGPQLVALTAASDGVVALTRRLAVAHPALVSSADVITTIGAGDVVSAALIDGLWGMNLLGASHRSVLSQLGEPDLAGLCRNAMIAAAQHVTGGLIPEQPTGADESPSAAVVSTNVRDSAAQPATAQPKPADASNTQP